MASVAKHKRERLAGIRCYLQSTQGTIIGVRRPCQHRGATARAQTLLGGPQRIAWIGVDNIHARHHHTTCFPAWRVRHIRWRDDHDGSAGSRATRQCGQYQVQFADTVSGKQDLRQRRLGPPAAWKRRIERRPTGRLIARRCVCRTPAPDLTAFEHGCECDDVAHDGSAQIAQAAGDDTPELQGLAFLENDRFEVGVLRQQSDMAVYFA